MAGHLPFAGIGAKSTCPQRQQEGRDMNYRFDQHRSRGPVFALQLQLQG